MTRRVAHTRPGGWRTLNALGHSRVAHPFGSWFIKGCGVCLRRMPHEFGFARAVCARDTDSASLSQKSCSPADFPTPIQTDTLFTLSLEGLSLSIQTTCK